MPYDCHLEVSSLTPRERVSAYLSQSKPTGVVYVQKGTDHRSRSEWLKHMGGAHRACGVVVVDPYDANDGFARLTSLGVCGALLVEKGPVSAVQLHEQIRRLHEALPRHWHLELELPWITAAALAPLLVRTDRVFCLTPQPTRAGLSSAVASRLLWWLDMGNAYVKFTGAHVEECAGSMHWQVCRSTPDRVVVGGGETLPLRHTLWWDEDLISLEQADDNAQRLYPFFRTRPIHSRPTHEGPSCPIPRRPVPKTRTRFSHSP